MMTPVRGDLPSGTVTFLFTDIEGSTRLLHALGPEPYATALAEHRHMLRDAFAVRGGVEVDTQGDAFFVAFPTAEGAAAAAIAGNDALASGPIRVRMGLHTGTPTVTDEGYVGVDVHRGARIAALAHGGQVLISETTHALLPSGSAVLDLGVHRLKDFDGPVRLLQLGSHAFPVLRTPGALDLPTPATRFLGRERELFDGVSLVLERDPRVLTIVGPGGTGKTRFALELARLLAEEADGGTLFVPLAPLRDPALIVPTVAQRLGAATADVAAVAARVGEKRTVLLLDNVEQLLPAAARPLAELVAGTPALRLLVTSREAIRIQGEVELDLPPLEVDEAVELFLERALAVRPGTERTSAVEEICRCLDGLPLALELAAARLKLLSPEQLVERLGQRLDLLRGTRDADDRHATLRATIAWSYDLLDDAERRLFARLAVFRGGCTLEAAEEVAEADLDTLGSLVDKSLLRHSEERFWMLETIREYAAERLEESGEVENLRRRHADHFLALAEEVEPSLFAESTASLDRLEREHDNLRAALDRLEASGESERALRLAGAVSRFWYRRGHLAEGGRYLENLLAADGRSTPARAKALNGAARLALHTGDFATLRVRAEEALALHRALVDQWGTADSRYLLGAVVAEEGDFAEAQQLLEESVREFRELGDEHYALLATRALAWMCSELGDRDRARALSEDNLRRARATGNVRMEARSLSSLAEFPLGEGRFQDALSMLNEAYRIDRVSGYVADIAMDLCKFAEVLAAGGRAEAAARLLSRGEAVDEEIGAGLESWAVEMNERTLTTIRTQLDEAAFAEAWEQGQALTLDAAVAVALALDSPG